MHMTSEERHLFAYLQAKGASSNEAGLIVKKFLEAFQLQALHELNRYIELGWTPADIYRLLQNGADLCNTHPVRPLIAEGKLIDLGMDHRVARHTVISKSEYSRNEPDHLQRGIDCFRELGVSHRKIELIAENHPALLYAEPEQIHAALATQLKERQLVKPLPADQIPTAKATHILRDPERALTRKTESELQQSDDLTMDRTRYMRLLRGIYLHEPRREPEVSTEEADEDAPTLHKREPQQHDRKRALKSIPWDRFVQTHGWIFDEQVVILDVIDLLGIWTSNQSTRDAFIRRVLMDPILHPILRLAKGTLNFRMLVIRKFLRVDYLEYPNLLLLAFERHTATELNFRANEIERFKVPIHRCETILLEPTREGFRKRIEAYDATRYRRTAR